MGPNPIWQPFASSTAFITLVNAGLTGVFAALVAVAFDAPGPLVGAVGVACGLAFLGMSAALAVRKFRRMIAVTSPYFLHPAPLAAGVATAKRSPRRRKRKSRCDADAWQLLANCSHSSTFVTKGYGSSWIFELVLTWANALQRVQSSAFSLVASA
jgi:hypothetical protein